MLNRMLRRQLLHEWLLLSAIASIMVIGVMCFVAMQSAYQNLRHAQRDYYRRCRMADFWINLKKAPAGVLQQLESAPGVRDARGRIQFYATVDLDTVDKPLNCQVLSLPERREPVINDVVMASGSYFTDQDPNEVIVVDQFARAHAIRSGQTIHLMLNNRRQPLKVVGTAMSSEFTYLLGPGSLVPDPSQYGVFWIKRSFAEDVFDFESAVNEIVGRWASPDEALQSVWLAGLEQQLEPSGVISSTQRKRQQSHQFLDGEIQGLGATATVIPTIFLVVAALILNVLVMRVARRQRVTVGTLKALGYSDRHIFLHFLEFGLAVGLLAGLAGCVGGYLSATGMTYMYRYYFEFPSLPSRLYPYAYLIGLSISLACAAVGSLRGARTVYRLQPAESMRPEPPVQGGPVWLERVVWLWKRLTTPWRLALRGLIRQPFRSAVSVFSAAMGSTLLTTGFLMVETTFFLVDFQFREVTRSDVELTFEDERDWSAVDEASRLPGIDRVEPVLYVPCTFVQGPYRYKSAITGLAAGARLTVPRTSDGTPIRIPAHGLVLTKRLAEILHLNVGDRLQVIPTRGQRRPQTVTVVGIADSFLGLAAYTEIHFASRLLQESFAVSGVQMESDQIADHQRRRNLQLKETPGVSAVQSRHEMIASIRETVIQNLSGFIVVLVVFSGIIFFGSLLNASMVNLGERLREVATLRALGYSNWYVGGLFLRESIVIGTLGTFAGLPLGYGLMWLATLAYRENDLIRMPVATAGWVWSSTLVLAALFVILAHVFVHLRITRQDFREALNVRE